MKHSETLVGRVITFEFFLISSSLTHRLMEIYDGNKHEGETLYPLSTSLEMVYRRAAH